MTLLFSSLRLLLSVVTLVDSKVRKKLFSTLIVDWPPAAIVTVPPMSVELVDSYVPCVRLIVEPGLKSRAKPLVKTRPPGATCTDPVKPDAAPTPRSSSVDAAAARREPDPAPSQSLLS